MKYKIEILYNSNTDFDHNKNKDLHLLHSCLHVTSYMIFILLRILPIKPCIKKEYELHSQKRNKQNTCRYLNLAQNYFEITYTFLKLAFSNTFEYIKVQPFSKSTGTSWNWFYQYHTYLLHSAHIHIHFWNALLIHFVIDHKRKWWYAQE